MAVINISLPDQMREYVETRISEGAYNTTSEYFRDLIREDQKRQAQEKLEALLTRGLESSVTQWTADDVDNMKNAVRERLAAKRSST